MIYKNQESTEAEGEENQTATVSKRDEAIDKLKEALTNEKWIKENLYMKKSFLDDKISEDTEQLITFAVINNEDEKTPIVVVQTETNLDTENSKQLSIIRYKDNKLDIDNLGVQNGDFVNYNIKDNILIGSWQGRGGWDYVVYKINKSKAEEIEKNSGLDTEEEESTEVENIVKKYSAKPISKKLNNSNVEKYIK